MDKTNPTRFQRFKNGIFGRLQDVWPGGAAGYVRWIDRSGTTVLAIGKGPLMQVVRAQGLENYRRVGRGADLELVPQHVGADGDPARDPRSPAPAAREAVTSGPCRTPTPPTAVPAAS